MRDNYETYDLTNFPLLRNNRFARLFLRAMNAYLISHSQLVSYVSKALQQKYRGGIVIPNGVEPLFQPRSKRACRKALKLSSAPLIAYVGGVSKVRGVDILLEAFERVRMRRPTAQLLLSGKVSIPIEKPGVLYL